MNSDDKKNSDDLNEDEYYEENDSRENDLQEDAFPTTASVTEKTMEATLFANDKKNSDDLNEDEYYEENDSRENDLQEDAFPTTASVTEKTMEATLFDSADFKKSIDLFVRYLLCKGDKACIDSVEEDIMDYLSDKHCLDVNNYDDFEKKCFSLIVYKISEIKKIDNFVNQIINKNKIEKNSEVKRSRRSYNQQEILENVSYNETVNSIDQALKSRVINAQFLFNLKQEINKIECSTKFQNTTNSYNLSPLQINEISNSTNISRVNSSRNKEMNQSNLLNPIYIVLSLCLIGIFMLILYPVYRPLINSLKNLICGTKRHPNSKIKYKNKDKVEIINEDQELIS